MQKLRFQLVNLDRLGVVSLLRRDLVNLDRRSVLNYTGFSTQLPIAKWHEFIKEPTLADSILDRLTAKAHRIELKG